MLDTDAIWANRLAAYPDRFDEPDLAGEAVDVPAHVELIGRAGVLIGGIDCVVTMEHDGDDWEIAAVAYRSEFGGPGHDFDAPRLRSRPPDGTLADLAEREILRLVDGQYNALADAATAEARAA
ncbi:hypothetical protein KL86PLE_90406 [uncultured Pleomorphomonas sp.]|uniref:Uncharacterized protein n=1 Tax=uncultured Pleomorphomonas sp. TaxID=442121 RepID=A0A212LPF0_9HYPH|nr:hypothetical protein [uncultured Pleomorphomonas sp.]SCM79445.1 hypothetical protein KL86PLE_90406 [uncultured Pleomorphomonas sp.]